MKTLRCSAAATGYSEPGTLTERDAIRMLAILHGRIEAPVVKPKAQPKAKAMKTVTKETTMCNTPESDAVPPPPSMADTIANLRGTGTASADRKTDLRTDLRADAVPPPPDLRDAILAARAGGAA